MSEEFMHTYSIKITLQLPYPTLQLPYNPKLPYNEKRDLAF